MAMAAGSAPPRSLLALTWAGFWPDPHHWFRCY